MQLYAEVQRNEKRESILKTVPVRFGTKYRNGYFCQQRFAIKKKSRKKSRKKSIKKIYGKSLAQNKPIKLLMYISIQHSLFCYHSSP